MKLVVGLGNPGPRYADTRHNVGFRAAERLSARLGIELDEARFGGRYGRGTLAPRDPGAAPLAVGVLLPDTYMNESGRAVAAAFAGLDLAGPGDLLVAYDDADLPFGRLRLRPGGSDGGHRGMRSVIEAVGTTAVPRLRFGIGRSATATDTREFVLDAFGPEEARALAGHLERAAEALEAALRDGMVAAMNAFNG